MYNLLRFLLPLFAAIIIFVTGPLLFKQPWIYWLIITILYFVIWVYTYPKQHEKLIKRQVKKMLLEGDNSSVFGKKTMSVDECEIKVFSDLSSETISKKSIKDIKVYDDMILVYLNGFTALIIPTRYLNDESQESLLKMLNG